MGIIKPIISGWRRITEILSAFYVRDNSGVDRIVYDSDGALYQLGTKITATAAVLNGTGGTYTNPVITGGAATDLKITNTTYATKSYTNTHEDWTLSVTEQKYPVIQIGGTCDGSTNVIVGDAIRIFAAVNAGTGQNAVFKTAAGTGITVATAKCAILWCNGVNVVRLTADA